MMKELWKMTAHQVKEAHFTKAIISIGSCEAHGQHICLLYTSDAADE